MKRGFLRAIGRLAGGLVLTVAYNALAFLLLSKVDPNARGVTAHILFGPGLLLAGPGFEAQAAVLPINIISFFCLFSIATWWFIGCRKKPEDTEE